jgi:phage replication-related protein YjqB (UPF0714/DUF867 family)
MDTYACYTDLANAEREGIDYEVIIRPLSGAQVTVIAPHGGGIEPYSEAIARAIAGEDFSFYCFRGCKLKNNGKLHITSHRFDEPGCVALIADHRWVVAIHGCDDEGEQVLLGGLDTELIRDLAAELSEAGISAATSGHDYPGTHRDNICNRGQSGKGVQIELTPAFRSGSQIKTFVAAVQSVLGKRQARAALAGD